MKKTLKAIVFSLLTVPLLMASPLEAIPTTPIAPDPVNPHYFYYDGQTIALVGASAEYLCHVSCKTAPGTTCDDQKRLNSSGVEVLPPVITSDFWCRFESYPDYIAELKARGLNKMRLWVGLNHSPGWQRTANPNPYDYEQAFPWDSTLKKWDMSTWSTPFFNRLRAILLEAQNNGVIVEITVFDPWSGSFAKSPWNSNTNIQKLGFSDPNNPADPNDPDGAGPLGPPREKYFAAFDNGSTDSIAANQTARAKQCDAGFATTALLQRLAFRINDFHNFYWEIANEPELSNPPDGVTAAEALAWHNYIAKKLYDYEGTLPNGRHMIAANFHTKTAIDTVKNGSATYPNISPLIQIVNAHYVKVSNGTPDPYGALPFIRDYNNGQYGQLNRVFGFNEGRITPDYDQPTGSDRSGWSARAEAWEFMLSGGGVYDHLGYDWRNSSVASSTRGYLRRLADFLKTIDLRNMNRRLGGSGLPAFIVSGLPAYGSGSTTTIEPYWGAMQSDAANNQQFVLYIHRSKLSTHGAKKYIPTSSGTFSHNLVVNLGTQSGRFRVEWIRPSDGAPLAAQPAQPDIDWNPLQGSVALNTSPSYNFDIALRIKRLP